MPSTGTVHSALMKGDALPRPQARNASRDAAASTTPLRTQGRKQCCRSVGRRSNNHRRQPRPGPASGSPSLPSASGVTCHVFRPLSPSATAYVSNGATTSVTRRRAPYDEFPVNFPDGHSRDMWLFVCVSYALGLGCCGRRSISGLEQPHIFHEIAQHRLHRLQADGVQLTLVRPTHTAHALDRVVQVILVVVLPR